MAGSESPDTLNRMADDCEALRSRLVRIAKALLVAEDTRAQALMRGVTETRTRAEAETLVAEAERARDLADMAAVVVARFERLDPRLNLRSVPPTHLESGEGTTPVAM